MITHRHSWAQLMLMGPDSSQSWKSSATSSRRSTNGTSFGRTPQGGWISKRTGRLGGGGEEGARTENNHQGPAVIKSDGKVVREVRPTQDDDGKTVSCFLVSQPGKVSAEMLFMVPPQT